MSFLPVLLGQELASTIFTLLTGQPSPRREAKKKILDLGFESGLSPNGYATLAAILGSVTLGAVGAVVAAREISHSRITYTEGPTKSGLVEVLGNRKVMTALAGLGVAGVVASLFLLPPKTAEEQQAAAEQWEFQWKDPWVKTKGIDVVIFGSGGTATPGGYTGGGGIPPSGPAGGPPTKPPLP